MNLGVFLLSFLLTILSANANIRTINHDQVQSFPEQKPVTRSEKSAIKYKSQLHVSYGCDPYPAVQADGRISGGLKWSNKPDGDCKYGDQPSQVYSRSRWYKEKWAIVYAWYLPKGAEGSNVESGHRHFWLFGIMWTDNFNPDNSTILGVSTSPHHVSYEINGPLDSKYVFNGTTFRFESYWRLPSETTAIKLTRKPGRAFNLVTWEQLTDEARDALSEFDFGSDTFKEVLMPLIKGRRFYYASQRGVSFRVSEMLSRLYVSFMLRVKYW